MHNDVLRSVENARKPSPTKAHRYNTLRHSFKEIKHDTYNYGEVCPNNEAVCEITREATSMAVHTETHFKNVVLVP